MNDRESLAGAGTANCQMTIDLCANTKDYDDKMNRAEKLGNQFASTLTNAFVGLATKGKSLSDTLRGVALQLSTLVLKSALKPLESGLGQMFGNLFNKGLAFAKGGAISNGLPIPFAQGGVIQSPVTFPLAGGRMGLMGERGPEAIMPLTRGPDGRLGVATTGAGRGMNVTFNISTPDADSFRRSETQMAALLTRAVSLGQRNL